MRILLLLLVLGTNTVLFSVITNAQELIDSLETELELTTNDRVKVNIANELSYQFRYSNKDTAFYYATRANDLANKIGYRKGIADSHVRLGILYKNKGWLAEAEDHYLKAAHLRTELKDSIGLGSVYGNLGVLAKMQSRYKDAISHYETGLNYLRNSTSLRARARLLGGLGNVLIQERKYDRATDNFEESFRIREELRDTIGMANTRLDQGTLFWHLSNLEKSKDYLMESLGLFTRKGDENGRAKCYNSLGTVFLASKDSLSARNYYEQALKLKKYLAKVDVGKILKNLGIIAGHQRELEMALNYFDRGLEIFQEGRHTAEIASTKFGIGEAYKNTGNYPVAIDYHLNALQTLDTISNKGLRLKILFYLSQSYRQNGELGKAVDILNEYHALNKSLDQDYRSAINKQLQLEEEKLLAEQIRREQDENGYRKSSVRWLSAVLFLSSVSFILIIAWMISQKKRQLYRNQVNNLLHDLEIETHFARITGQEYERQRIAKDLHDGVGTILATVQSYFKNLDKQLENLRGDGRKQYVKGNELLGEATEEVRRISHEMQSEVLANFGLRAELESFAENIREASGMNVELNIHGYNKRLDAVLEIKVYRIFQEAVNNVLKHARAENLTLQLNRFSDMLNVIIEDDGKGFDLEKARNKDGLGIKNMESRVHDLKGEIRFDSKKGRGTTITVDIPLSE